MKILSLITVAVLVLSVVTLVRIITLSTSSCSVTIDGVSQDCPSVFAEYCDDTYAFELTFTAQSSSSFTSLTGDLTCAFQFRSSLTAVVSVAISLILNVLTLIASRMNIKRLAQGCMLLGFISGLGMKAGFILMMMDVDDAKDKEVSLLDLTKDNLVSTYTGVDSIEVGFSIKEFTSTGIMLIIIVVAHLMTTVSRILAMCKNRKKSTSNASTNDQQAQNQVIEVK